MMLAFQIELIDPTKSNESVQPMIGVVPVFVIVMLPVNPLPQSLTSANVDRRRRALLARRRRLRRAVAVPLRTKFVGDAGTPPGLPRKPNDTLWPGAIVLL